MKKYLIIILLFLFSILQVSANEIDKYLKNSNLGFNATLSIYMEDNEGNIFYKKNEDKSLNPASSQKLATFAVSYFILGEDYNFETGLYHLDNDLYIKLGADVLLTSNDLENLFKGLSKKIDIGKIKNIYIDDSIIDKTKYPSTWLEEDMWPNGRFLTPYIVDSNYTQIALNRSSLSTKVDIIQNDDYKFPIINELKLGDSQNYKIERPYGENSPILNFKGTINEDEIIKLPVLNPEINFNIKLKKALNKNNIIYLKDICQKQTPKNAKKIAFVSHNMKDVSKEILINSNNFASEIVFKIAGAKYINYIYPAKEDDSIKMFYDFYKDIITDDIKIFDASGVSVENRMNTKFICDVIKKYYLNSNLKDLMASSNQGTLKDRLLFLQNNLKAKTGTRKGASSLSGIFSTQNGKELVFSIIIKSEDKRKALIKNFENSFIGYIYRKY